MNKKMGGYYFEEQPYLANVYPGDTREIGLFSVLIRRNWSILILA